MGISMTLYFIQVVGALLCYNGTFTYKQFGEDPLQRRSFFVRNNKDFSRLRCSSTTLCRARAMCFVRSWSARAKHAWIIQRGCYQVVKDDTLPQDLSIPTRAMTCKHQRFADAEYKVCLCQADWCNTASSRIVYTSLIKNGMWAWAYLFALCILIRTYV